MGKLIWVQTHSEDSNQDEHAPMSWIAKAICGAFKGVHLDMTEFPEEMIPRLASQLKDQSVHSVLISDKAIAHAKMSGGLALLPFGSKVKGIELKSNVYSHIPTGKGKERDTFMDKALSFLKNYGIDGILK